MEQPHIKTTFEFISTKDKLPPTSGTYLTMNASGTMITTLPFSTCHQVFNAHDDDDEASFAINVAYWAHIPKKLKDVMSKVWEDSENDD